MPSPPTALLRSAPDLLFRVPELAANDSICHSPSVVFVVVALATIGRDDPVVIGSEMPSPLTVVALKQEPGGRHGEVPFCS